MVIMEPGRPSRCLLHEMDEATALAGARRGDLDAYEFLVARHTVAAHRTAVLLGAGDDADDVVQESFVKAFHRLGHFRGDAGFRTWLLAIIGNETRNLHRSRKRRDGLALRAAVAAAGPEPADVDDPVESAVAADRRRRLVSAIETLDGRDRDVVVCRYLLELSEAETAATLALPKGTVKSRTARALVKLRDRLRGWHGDARPAEEVPDGRPR
jgi:RNA polymerase sigma-70 factor (ECF subfamily)